MAAYAGLALGTPVVAITQLGWSVTPWALSGLLFVFLSLAIYRGGRLEQILHGGIVDGLKLSPRIDGTEDDNDGSFFEYSTEFWIDVTNSLPLQEVLLKVETAPTADRLPGRPKGYWNIKWRGDEHDDGFAKITQHATRAAVF